MLIPYLLSVIAPHDCLGCEAEGPLLCRNCRLSLSRAVPRCYICQKSDESGRTCGTCRATSPLYAVRSAVNYEGLAKTLVWKLKFGRAQAASKEIADIMSECLSLDAAGPLIVTHLPTASSRVRQRGYDQAALIAKAFARNESLAYTPLLGRLGSHKQIGANRETRHKQLQQAFRPLRASKIAGATILLVDDVITTGSSMESAATVLRAAGAKRVIGLTFAQA